MKLGKEENRETKNRIGQDILAREKREVTRKRGGKEENWERRNRETETQIDPLTSNLSPLFRQGRELRTNTGLIAVNNGAAPNL
jgi:hypothetical protein